jgi:hypothetical protein
VLSIGRCRDLGYNEREVINGREDYLSEAGTSPGRWVGRLAATDGSARPAGAARQQRPTAGHRPPVVTAGVLRQMQIGDLFLLTVPSTRVDPMSGGKLMGSRSLSRPGNPSSITQKPRPQRMHSGDSCHGAYSRTYALELFKVRINNPQTQVIKVVLAPSNAGSHNSIGHQDGGPINSGVASPRGGG